MGIFVDYPSNIFVGLKEIPTTIVTASTNVLWITSIIVCNRGAAPIRFNLQKSREQGVVLENPCYTATISNLVATYNNGTMGIGATLTNNGTLAIFSVDGLSPSLNARILVKDQSSTFQNGIYTVTTIGDNISIPWVLTRAIDFDSPLEIKNGVLVFVQSGTINSNTQWIQISTVTTVGTDAIIFISNLPIKIFYINELEIKPYTTIDIIDITGVINLEYNLIPYISDSLVCFSNGYTQIFDCDVIYAQLNELPMT